MYVFKALGKRFAQQTNFAAIRKDPPMLLFLELIPYIVIFIFGITIGSFLNVCIYRMPLHESIVTAPSHCMTCGSELHWYDMVPVFSWLILGGKCRSCKAKISAQYPIIEALNGVLYVLVCVVNGMNLSSGVMCLMTSALIVLSVIDWQTYEIPVSINIFLVIYLLSGGRAIGGGDIKLMVACGLILGWQLIILAFFLGCIIGSVTHLIRIRVSGAGHMLAMGPYLSAGIFIAALWGNSWIHWYMGMLGIY